MTKTAVIYDKWLDSMGGGEVVACNMVKILLDKGYKVTLACRKKVPINTIVQKLNIDITGVEFYELWNDEDEIQKLTQGKDLFINISFMDYSVGKAKKNIYYAHFPTPVSVGPVSYLKNEVLFPLLSRYLKPIEFIHPPAAQSVHNNHINYLLDKKTSLGFSYLKKDQTYNLRFFLHHEQISKTTLESVKYELAGADILNQKVTLDHRHNVLKYQLSIVAKKSTILLSFFNPSLHKVSLIEPRLEHLHFNLPLKNYLERSLGSKIRAGAYTNVLKRINQYDQIVVHSEFVKIWVKKYWSREALVLYPPVDLISMRQKIDFSKKENIICSVGRFFTLGHGKRQDIMIMAFKKLYDSGLKDWKLVLAGGLGSEPTSLAYYEKLQKMAKGYPIEFLINRPKSEIEQLYLKSKIYWHAAGYGINQNKYPIKLEHFGITPVEAMSAGCIPVVFNGGGLPEILNTLGLKNKIHVFSSITQLAIRTNFLISQNKISDSMFNSKHLEKYFGQYTFKNNFTKVIL